MQMERKGRRRPSGLSDVIRRRLLEYVRDYCGNNQSEFARRVGVPRTTVTGWFRRTAPHTPDITQLIDVATKGNMNLNWLLLGELPRLRGELRGGSNLRDQYRAAVIAELATQKGLARRGALIEMTVPSGKELFRETVGHYLELLRQRAQPVIAGVVPFPLSPALGRRMERGLAKLQGL